MVGVRTRSRSLTLTSGGAVDRSGPFTSSSPTVKTMSTKTTDSELNVSFEPHLVDALRPLVLLLPDDLSSKLMVALAAYDSPSSSQKPNVPSLIPFSLLSGISSWARSSMAASKLSSQNPPLDPLGYSMVALLAGTKTSPERKFPDVLRVSHDAELQRARSDRRAIVALLNALLSVIGSGVATWWATQRLSWENEWVRNAFAFSFSVLSFFFCRELND